MQALANYVGAQMVYKVVFRDIQAPTVYSPRSPKESEK